MPGPGPAIPFAFPSEMEEEEAPAGAEGGDVGPGPNIGERECIPCHPSDGTGEYRFGEARQVGHHHHPIENSERPEQRVDFQKAAELLVPGPLEKQSCGDTEKENHLLNKCSPVNYRETIHNLTD